METASTFQGVQTACPACGREVQKSRCEYCGATTQAGRWRVERVLAQTPHSRVYVATDEQGQRVALKELHFAAVPSIDQVEAFQREAKTLEALKHSRVPAFLQSFTVGDGVQLRFYLAFELIEGESLAARVQRGSLTSDELRDVAMQALDALSYLHGRHPAVVHRDVKPENIVFKRDGTLCLVDFGSVRRVEGSRTHRSTLVGTFGYMPPEQLGGTVDCSSDIYALGATLLHAATGKSPQALLDERLGLKVPPTIPAWLKVWLERAIELEPKKRYRDAQAALAALNSPPSVLHRQVSPVGFTIAMLVSVFLGLVGLPAFRSAQPQDHNVVVAPVVAPGPSTGAQWFQQVRTHCNPVEVAQTMLRVPPPDGVEGSGYGASCYALAGKMAQAKHIIDRMQDHRLDAVAIMFNVAHPIADMGDDESTAPIMKLVVDYWPNHFMALYHLGVAEYGQADYAGADKHLREFLQLYNQPDGFTHTAQRALRYIQAGAPYPALNAVR